VAIDNCISTVVAPDCNDGALCGFLLLQLLHQQPAFWETEVPAAFAGVKVWPVQLLA
jgi:hypothetical protein